MRSVQGIMDEIRERQQMLSSIAASPACPEHGRRALEICTECLAVSCSECTQPCQCWNDE